MILGLQTEANKSIGDQTALWNRDRETPKSFPPGTDDLTHRERDVC